MTTIAVIGGTGKEGKGLALRWAAAGYDIIIGSRDAERATAAAQELNAALGKSTVSGLGNVDAARAAEIVVDTAAGVAPLTWSGRQELDQ